MPEARHDRFQNVALRILALPNIGKQVLARIGETPRSATRMISMVFQSIRRKHISYERSKDHADRARTQTDDVGNLIETHEGAGDFPRSRVTRTGTYCPDCGAITKVDARCGA